MGKTMDEFAKQTYSDWQLQRNFYVLDFYRKELERIVLSLFKWEGLPENINARFLERVLFEDGLAIFYKSAKYGCFRVARGTASGSLTWDEEVASYTITDPTGTSETLGLDECIPIFNNKEKSNSLHSVIFFADRMNDVEKTLSCNLKQMRHPVIISCPEGQKLTADSLIEDVENGVAYIKVPDGTFDRMTWQALDMKVNSHIKELQEVKHEYKNEALTFFGVDNVNVFKRERLTAAEGSQNNDEISFNLHFMYDTRIEGAKKISEMTGSEVSVTLNKDVVSQIETIMGGERNE